MLKKFLIPTLILAVAVPVFAQRQKVQRLRERPAIRARGARKSLNLTEEQRRNLQSIRESNRAQRQAIAQDVRQKAQALRDVMAQSNPNPTDVGNAMLALRQARGRGQELRNQTLETFKRSLTPEQQQRFEIPRKRRPNV